MDAIERLRQDEKKCWEWFNDLDEDYQNELIDRLIFKYWEKTYNKDITA